ncbi:MAG: ABC transporter ATP-binding protein/permease [Bifidobacteriaceae bacterium]|jgi:ATP-binding cassette subfamily B protein|nr:ABC transporter ATP-binding protein/permease [Bifidobacteriaceae bacterium]
MSRGGKRAGAGGAPKNSQAVARGRAAAGPRFGPGGPPLPGAKALHFRESGLRFLRLLAPERAKIAGAMILTVASVALSVIGPKILGQATNRVFEGFMGKLIGQRLVEAGLLRPGETMPKAQVMKLLEAMASQPQSGGDEVNASMADMLGAMDFTAGVGVDFGAVGLILTGVLAIYLGSALLGYVQGIITAQIIQNSMYRLRRDVEVKLGRLPLKYFDGQPKGEVLSRVTNDIDNVGQTLQQTMTQLLFAVFSLVGILVMMLTISGWLTLVAVASIPLAAVVTALIAKRAQPQFVKQWASTGELNTHIEEMYTGHAVVKLFGRQAQARAELRARNAELYEASFKAQAISMAIQPVMGFVSNLVYVVIAVLGGLRVASGTMSLGDVQAFIQYSRQFSQPVGQIASMMNLLQSGVASVERVFELLDAEELPPDAAEPKRLDDFTGRVDFDRVKFAYDPDQPLIENLRLWAKPGQTVAIVGPTGAGKTTLVNLLERFYEIEGGAITLDGVDIRDLTREHLRSKMGMVLQDTWLFSGTIYDNIRYGRLDATEAEILAAARATYVDRFVHALPDGYQTMIEEDAANISAGERQLLTIARAFLADPAILILDEATSSVDTRTEVLVQQAMNKLRRGRTSFVIAHRLSTIRDADVIVVMEHGSVVEKGDHEELLAAKGAYWRLYQSQFAGADLSDDVDEAPSAPIIPDGAGQGDAPRPADGV